MATFEDVKAKYLELRAADASWEELDSFLGSQEQGKKSLIQRLSRAGVYAPKPRSTGRPIGRPPVKPGMIERIVERNPDMDPDHLKKLNVAELRNILQVVEHPSDA